MSWPNITPLAIILFATMTEDSFKTGQVEGPEISVRQTKS